MQDEELLLELKSAVRKERESTTRVLHLLMKAEKSKLYARRGYDSLFSFAVGYLGYSEPAANRRIQAMRAIREFPSLEPKITSGVLNLTNLAQVQVAIRQEAKAKGTVASSVKLELFKAVEKKSTRECEKIIRTHMPDTLPQERRRVLTENKTELKMVLDEATIQMLQKLKELWSHKNPNMTDSEIVKTMAEFCLSKVDPIKRENKKVEASKVKVALPATKTTAPESRHIPNSTRRFVWKRDNGCCQFKDPLTGKICGSKQYLETDHIFAWALGGTHDPSNLRLLCRTHNTLRAEQTFRPVKKSVQILKR